MAPELDEQGRALLDAASKLLSEEGAARLTVRRIATEAGCSTMGVYSRFGGKEGVIEQLVAEGFERLGATIDSVPVTDDPVHDLHECGLAYRRNALANARHYVVMFGSRVPGFQLSAETAALGLSTFTRLVGRVRRCQEAGRFVLGRPDAIAEVIWGAIHGHVMLELTGRSVTDIDPADRYERTLRLIEEGFGAPGAGAPRGESGAGGI